MNRSDDRVTGPPAGQIHWSYSKAELWADGVVHLIGMALAVTGMVFFAITMPPVSGPQLFAAGVYLATLIVSVGASAAYNIWPVSPAKWILRRLDHAAIYLLIAGTYAPIMVKLGTWRLLAFVWAVSVLGAAVKWFFPGRYDRLSIGLYLAIGWSGVLVANRLLADLPSSTLWLIGSGGLVYSLGVVFHLWERLRFQNAIWHGFVLTASAFHFAAVWTTVQAAA